MSAISPARCTAELADDLENPNLVSELKIDGSRYVFYIGFDPYERQSENALLSRRISTIDGKHVDRTGNAPHFMDLEYPDLSGTVLDGECFHTDFPTTQSIMGSSPKVAIATQEGVGKITYWAFDVVFYRGRDIRGLPLLERRKVLEHVISKMNNPFVKAIPQWTSDHAQEFARVVDAGGEGIIVKDLRCGYGVSWAKMKKSFDVSCFISGFKNGNGKYASSIGSIALGVYDENGNIIEVGFASGFDDALRNKIATDPKKYLYSVVDVFAHEISKDKRLRHPTFHRLRDDMEETDCTMDKLISDLKKNTKSKRFKHE